VIVVAGGLILAYVERSSLGGAHATIAHVRHVTVAVGFDLGAVSFGPTPVAILITCLIVGAVLLLLFLLASQVGGVLVDRRWPANEALTPSEVLWGESGGYVKKSFPGLDPIIARDLTQYIRTAKIKPGTSLVEAGDLPTQFILLKSGAAEIVGSEGPKQLQAGDSLGGDNIISRRPHQFTVRATAPTELVSLGAEDYLAAMALGMSDDDDDYVVNVLGGYFDDDAAGRTQAVPAMPAGGAVAPAPVGSRTQASAPAAPPPMQQRPAPVPTSAAGPPPAPPQPPVAPVYNPPAAPAANPVRWASATHRVVQTELPGYVLPAGDTATRVLPGGAEVEQLESLPGWAHVRTVDGWQGWVADHGLNRL
jgi:hypothetical protein